MAIPFLNHLDLRSVSELQNAILHKTTSGSASDVEGKIIYDTGTDTIKFYNGSAWISLGAEVNTTYDLSVPSSTTAIRLAGSDSTNDDITITGGTNVTVTRTSGTELTIDAGAATTVGKTNSTQRSGSIELIAGTNVSITEDGTTGHFTFASTNTNQLTTFTLRDDDNDDVTIAHGKFLKFVSATGTAGTNVTGSGTTGDPFLVTITSPDTTTDVDVTVANLKTRLGSDMGGAVSIGDSNDTITIPGNLIVTGDTTYHNETIQVVENNTISFEGATADAHEIKLTSADADSDKTITLPNATGGVAVTYSTTIGDASNTSYTVTHSLNTQDVIVQLYDASSLETVHADVVRTNATQITITFASAPTSNDIKVLVARI